MRRSARMSRGRIRSRWCCSLVTWIGETVDREAFQEIDFPAMFAPIAKWAAKIDDAARIPEYVARAWNVAMSGRPGPVVLALPEDMLLDAVVAVDRPRVDPIRLMPDGVLMDRLASLLREAKAPIAIVGGAGWDMESGFDASCEMAVTARTGLAAGRGLSAAGR